LRGKVLPVGGLMEKVAAAHRAGISRIVIPKQNVKDLKDIPRSISKDVNFIPVERVDEVFEVALMDFDPSQQSLESLLRKELEKALTAEQKKKKARKRRMTSARSSAKISRKKKAPRKR
jgi:predicted ATP-dependent protease